MPFKGNISLGSSTTTDTIFWKIPQEENDMSDRITVDPMFCHDKPCIRGLRYPVENVLEWLASGMTTDEILADYEDLEREDILAALSYAARLARVNLRQSLAV